MNTPFLKNAFSFFQVSENITAKQGKQEEKLEIKMQQKEMNINQTLDYLALGLSAVDALVPANTATSLEE